MDKWYRVNRKSRCRQCGRGDWCTYTLDGAVCCMRVKSDVPMKNGGWLHRTDNPAPLYMPPRKAIQERPPDLAGLWGKWLEETSYYEFDGFAMSLGVDTEALKLIGCARSPNAWAFPMKNADGEMIGIRLRNNDGSKYAVKGSKQGLFLSAFGCEPVAYVTEGPTDTAAALTIGLSVIGRPSCLGQEDLILSYIQRQKIRRVVIVTDNDSPGLRGAEKLRDLLTVPSCIYVPPCKDLRELVNLGGSKEMIEASVKDTIWTVHKAA